MQRVHLLVSGDVQGIGFRVWTIRQAQDLGCVGWVKNREDGAVEVVAEGAKENLEILIKQCHHGPEVAWVKEVTVEWGTATNEFVGFVVVY